MAEQPLGLYPFISKIKFIDQTFPDLTTSIPNSLNWCEPVILNDFTIYTVIPQVKTNGNILVTLVKLTQNDFHEHYYTITPATIDGTGVPSIEFSATDNSNIKLYLNLNANANQIYLFYYTLTSYIFIIYNISDNVGYDLTYIKQYNSDVNPNAQQFQFDVVYNSNIIAIGQFNNSTSILTINAFTPNNNINTFNVNINLQCTVNLKMLDNNYFCIIVRENITGKIFISYLPIAADINLAYPYTLNFNTDALPAIQVSKNSGLSQPCMPQIVNFNNMVALIYGFNNDINDVFQLAFIKTNLIAIPFKPPVDLLVPHVPPLNPAYYYKINKFDTFNEILDPEQNNMAVSVVSHPVNSDYFYVAYITSTNQIRVMKFFRNIINKKETHMPVLMWATRLGAFEHDQSSSTEQMSIMISQNGYVYVTIRLSSGDLFIYKINEFILDLGHAEGTIVSPVDTISTLLTTMPSYYTALSLVNSIHIPDLNYLNDIIISSITDNGKLIKITFKYINYDVFQLYNTILEQIKLDIIKAFQILYEDSSINVLNLNFSDVSIDGTSETIVAHFIAGTLKKPCVLKGTEIIIFKNGKASLINVEKIQIDDIVINHEGSHVRVLDHMVSTIYAQSHNAPYLICKNFFGEDRPYKDLYISGDHGILLNYKNRIVNVIYAQDIKILKQCFINKTVEFHHLLLEDHQTNFYLANGLEVDSYHPTIIMKR